MALQPVRYTLDDGTAVAFEIEPPAGFVPASARDVIGPMRAAVEPLIDSAKLVLEAARAAGPDAVEVRFGVKVSGSANWYVARAATEGNFEVTLSWSLRPGQDAAS
jgi:hypothetical protein